MGKAEQHATKKDIADLGIEFDSKLGALGSRLDARIDALEATSQATKKDIADLSNKLGSVESRLDANIERVAVSLVRTQADLGEMKADMSTKADIERVVRSMDAFAAQALHYQRADMIRGQTLIEIESRLGEHERRIAALESAPRPPAP